jgi:aminomethyltransferase
MTTTAGLKTPLYDEHVAAGARIVDFGGWDMPLHYGSQKEEHHAVRSSAGVFDVSHMTVVDVTGERAEAFLRFLLSNDVRKLEDPGKALYTCMLNERGGVIDDLIVYFFTPERYRLVVNAATRVKDIAWITARAEPFGVDVVEREDLAMIAVQGPDARELAAGLLPAAERATVLALKPFFGTDTGEWFVARTGYTGEDGFEMIVPAADAPALWKGLIEAGVTPAGLAARDTLRLEAAMNLYGNDMDEDTSPLEAGLGWTIAWEPGDRDFIGREAVESVRADSARQRFVGLILEDKGVLRAHQRVVVEGIGEGETTSGGFAPTIGRSIGLARVPAGDYDRAKVDIRGKLLDVRIVPTPFVRHGKIKIDV